MSRLRRAASELATTVILAAGIVSGLLFLGLAIGAFFGAIGWGFHSMCGCP